MRQESSGSASNIDPMQVLSTIIAGILLYGGIGWLGDHFLHTQFLLPAGLILGMGLAIYSIYRRFESELAGPSPKDKNTTVKEDR